MLRAGTAEVDARAARVLVQLDAHTDAGTVVHLVTELAVGEHIQHPAHRLLGIVLHMAHVGMHDFEAVVIDHLQQFLHALFTGRQLRLEVGNIHVRVARRIIATDQAFAHFPFEEATAIDDLQVVEQHALFQHRGRIRRHRTGGLAADIGMMASRGDIEQHPLFRGTGGATENRLDQGDIGQVGAAVVGRVEHEGITALHATAPLADHRLDALAHRPEMHRHVRRVGDQVAFGIEYRAGEIQPFLDVDRNRRVLQHRAHLLGDGHEQVVEDLQQYRVHLGAHGKAFGTGLVAFQQQVATARQAAAPARLDNDGAGRLDHHRRSLDPLFQR